METQHRWSVGSKQQILRPFVQQLLSICEDESDQTFLQKVWQLLPKHCSVKRHHKVCSSRTDTADEDSSDEEVQQITEVEMEEEAPIMNIFDILQNSAFVEVENEKDVDAFWVDN